jgi:hypothetical protein
LVTQSFYSRILTTRIVVQYISTTRISDLYMSAARISAPFMGYKTNVCPCLHQKAICGTRLFADGSFEAHDQKDFAVFAVARRISNGTQMELRSLTRKYINRPSESSM